MITPSAKLRPRIGRVSDAQQEQRKGAEEPRLAMFERPQKANQSRASRLGGALGNQGAGGHPQP